MVTFVFVVLTMLRNWFDRARGRTDGRGPHAFCSIWGRTIIRLTPGWKVTIEGREHLPPDYQPMVMVANHESMSDICAMYYLGAQFRWLSKESVFKIPFVGNAMRWANYVPILRGNRESAAQAMRESALRIRQGLSMFFFPEGTRSLDGVILGFKTGAFKLARDEKVPVLPIAIHGAGNLLPKHSWIPGKAHVRLKILAPMPPPAQSDSSVEAYTELVRARIVTAHDSLCTQSAFVRPAAKLTDLQ